MTASIPWPTLPPDWDPPGCLQQDDYWQWDYDDRNNRPTVFGGPSQTLSCFPSTWASTATYAGTACPPRYSEACPDLGEKGIVTCCPTAYAFSCQNQDFFKCATRYAESGGVLAASKKFMFDKSPPESTTLSQRSGSHLVALAVVFERVEIQSTPTRMPSDSASTATTGPSDPSSSDSSSGGLPTAAKAGVGVGVAVGVLLVVAIACWLIRRRRKTGQQPPDDAYTNTQYAHDPTIDDQAKTTGASTVYSPSELSPGSHPMVYGPHEVQNTPQVSGPHEMQNSPNRGAELPA
jgi:hypothetical protein